VGREKLYVQQIRGGRVDQCKRSQLCCYSWHPDETDQLTRVIIECESLKREAK